MSGLIRIQIVVTLGSTSSSWNNDLGKLIKKHTQQIGMQTHFACKESIGPHLEKMR